LVAKSLSPIFIGFLTVRRSSKMHHNGWQYEIVLDYEARTYQTTTNVETKENI